MLAQREVNYLLWASNLSAFLLETKAKKLEVGTCHQICAFGKWPYSSARA